MADAWWVQVGEGVFVRRHVELDLSLGLVIGRRRCLVVDTGGDEIQGAQYAKAVREMTDLPWTVVLTHAHFDHAFGAAAFGGAFAHPGCRAELAVSGERQRAEWVARYRREGRPEVAGRIAATRIVLPEACPDEVDLGGRVVRLSHPGAGHTDHDLIAFVPDAEVLFAGDLVEEGAPPAFEGSVPGAWAAALDQVLGLRPRVVVPGHGDPVDAAFVAGQRDAIALVNGLREEVGAGRLTVAEAIARSPFPEDATVDALSA